MTGEPHTDRLLVRAVLRDAADEDEFDAWYRDHHLPDAVRAFGAVRAERYWSYGEEGTPVHYAVYFFASHDDLVAVRQGESISALIAEFTQRWGDRVHRVRSHAVLAGEIVPTDG